jgi:hypothetical protein
MEILPFFIQTFLTLAERIKSLKEGSIQNRRQAFEQIIEPLFIEVRPVVDNYFELFQKAKQMAKESRQEDLGSQVEEIRKARETMIRTRVTIREMVNQIQKIYKDKKIIDFAWKLDSFFYRTVCERKVRGKSYALELVDLFDYATKNDLEKAELISFIDLALKNMENSWITIAQSYAALRIYCLSQPRDVTVG